MPVQLDNWTRQGRRYKEGIWKELRRMNNWQLFKDKDKGNVCKAKSAYPAQNPGSVLSAIIRFYSHPSFDTSPPRFLPAGKGMTRFSLPSVAYVIAIYLNGLGICLSKGFILTRS